MVVLIQRVLFAKVEVARQVIGAIDKGMLIFAAIEPLDDEAKVRRMVERLLGYRIFSDADDKMNLSVTDISGGVLIVPQFTLAADTKKGARPSFSSAADPIKGELLFNYFVKEFRAKYSNVATGKFGADMQVYLCNDGPVTFLLES